MNDTPVQIQLALVSHTNNGKTTLARTLLGADVGEVRDAAHVTLSSDAHPLLATSAGDALLLWDTPGFGEGQGAAGFAVDAVSGLNVVVVLAGQAQHVGRTTHPLVERGQERGLVDNEVVVVLENNEVGEIGKLHTEA